MWYVIQIQAGKEKQIIESIKRHVAEVGKSHLVKECFSPEYEMMIRFRGEWQKRMRPMLPGYVIVDTQDVDELHRTLKGLPEFTKLLGTSDGFVPLNKNEVAWISAIVQRGRDGSRTIEMSEGVMEGDEIIILNGPLINHTGWIKSVNRHKRLAYLELEMFGRTIQTKVGLNIVSRH